MYHRAQVECSHDLEKPHSGPISRRNRPGTGARPNVLLGPPHPSRKTAVNENVIDVLIYIYENYMDAEESVPTDQIMLEEELVQAGFPQGEIKKAFNWLDELAWRQGLARKGLLIVGDRKLCNRENTCFIANSGNYYLGPLAQRQYSVEELSQARRWIEQQPEQPQQVMRWAAGAKEARAIATVKELPSRRVVDSQGQEHWQRLIAVCSLNLRKRQREQ